MAQRKWSGGRMNVIKYINSSGREANLLDEKVRINEGNFHVRSWNVKTSQLPRGVKILSFDKNAVSYPVKVEIRGDLEDRKKILDEFNDIFDYDIEHEEPGRLYFNESYIRCFAVSSDSHPSENIGRSEADITFYAPYPFWIKEVKKSFIPTESDDAQSVYPKIYPYTYSLSSKQQNLLIDHYTDSDFQMVVYGPTETVNIEIAGHPYRVDYPVRAGECMIIDSRKNLDPDKRCYLIHADGTNENVFNYRNSEKSIFRKLPPGLIPVYYSRNHGLDITAFIERGEPRWI